MYYQCFYRDVVCELNLSLGGGRDDGWGVTKARCLPSSRPLFNEQQKDIAAFLVKTPTPKTVVFYRHISEFPAGILP